MASLARHLGSFQQLLLVAFLLIAALPGGIALHAVSTFDQLMGQSDTFSARALELSAAAQLLAERSTAMERAARQSIALEDAVLRRRFDQATRDGRETLARFSPPDVPSALTDSWSRQVQSIVERLAQPGESAVQRDGRVAAEFRELAALNTSIAQEVRHTIEERRHALQMQLQASRLRLTRLVWVAIGVALVLAGGFGVWLARPFRRIERAIQRIGEPRADGEPGRAGSIAINGPADVRRIGRQLEWLRLRLAELDADKTRFLRHVSHELKTPLAALAEGVSLLEDGTCGKLNDDQHEVARILHDNTVSLQAQIEALLRFNAAAFEASRLNRAPTDLAQLIEQQVEQQRLQWQARDLEVQVAAEPLVEPVDAGKLGTAIANLLSNAIRFSPPGGRIALKLYRAHDRTFIDVSDQGPGVADADANRVFEPFFRGQRQSGHDAKGSGIGLSLVREYVLAHGGRVDLVPRQDGAGGALFRIGLPHEE
ncbi:MAG: ATP-binding protein [Burkholderiales bacterium]